MTNYDLIVIGGGPGGYEAAAQAGQAGLKTLLIEKEQLGGVCLNSGCIPVKTLLAAVHFVSDIKKRSSLLNVQVNAVSLDYPKLIERKNRVVSRLQKGVELLLQNSKVDVIKGFGELLPGKKVKVSETVYSAKNIFIATGTIPGEIPGLAADGLKIFNSEQLLQLKVPPQRLLIVGAGVIGLEFADIFSSLGTSVTLVDILTEILPGEDRDAVAQIRKSLEAKGCIFKLGTKLDKIPEDTLVLIAAGRKGKIAVKEDLELEPGVYVVGDINNKAMYAHAATYQGIKIVKNIISGKKEPINLKTMPRVIFTSPQMAALGKIDGLDQQIKKFQLNLLGKAQTESRTEGFIKLFVQNSTNKIEGAVIVAENAEALIGEAVVLVNAGITLDKLSEMIHPHPTWSEVFSEASKG